MTDKIKPLAVKLCSPLVTVAIGDPALVHAWEHVQKNNGRPGVDGISVAHFAKKLFYHLGQLRLQVQTGSYVPGARREGIISSDDGKPPRRYSVINMRDRILQTAVADVLRPLIEPTFHEGSFAYRPGRSTRMAIAAIADLHSDGYRWVIHADIEDFFGAIDWPLMLGKLKEACRDEGIVALVSAWLQAPVQQADKTLTPNERGLPQGSPLSPLLSNLYLNELDRRLEGQGRRIIRYADDFLVLCRDQEGLEDAHALTENELAQLKLRLNPDKTRLTSFDEGFVFLGMHFDGDSMTPHKPDTGTCLIPAPVAAFKVDAGRVAPTPHASAIVSHRQAPALPEAPQHPPETLVPDGHEAEVVTDTPHLRTLYLLTPGLLLGRSNDRLTVSSKGIALQDIPVQTIDQVMALGSCTLTSPSLTLCAEQGVGLHIVDVRNKVVASLANAAADAVSLRRCQYQASFDAAICLQLAKSIINAKINNSRHVIARYLRHHLATNGEEGLLQLNALQKSARHAATLDELRGYEGASARVYFSLMRKILPVEWTFGARISHPPVDPVNALLSYGYAVLYGNGATLIQRRGLDPAFAFLHALKEGHLALASDFIEPYRAPIVDAVVLSLIFRHRIRPDDFVSDEDEALPCLMSTGTKRILIHALEEKFNSMPANLHQDYRRLMAQDVAQLARFLEGQVTVWEPLSL
ncbi:CRISPR-associated endonuclease Cas1 [Methylobacter psychrophilus]|uniref:CRISPR-associated endonuclease Cas1 n=1 Tax=Methylobacter psychrophilus TaxID=96941 RepID=UPI0021D48A58|nr:CRISPR-associated endonuclease Cas1 [Methylobacter psychrophilus]